MKRNTVILAVLVLATSVGCELMASGIGDVDALVPATVVDDQSLPSLEIDVRGRPARIHYRAYGVDVEAPAAGGTVLFLLHGSLSDMRGYLSLAPALAAEHPVFMWDLRGNGLSERVPAEELDFHWMADEIEAVRRLVAPSSQIVLLGYSWSGVFASIYAGQHPDRLRALILLEPPGLTGTYQNQVGGALNLFGAGYLGMTYLSEVVSPRDHATVDFRSLAMLESGVRDFFVDPQNQPSMPVWRVGGLALAVWEASVVGPSGFDYDFTAGLAQLAAPVLLVGTDHSPIGYEFQRDYNAREFPDARVALIENAGHRMIVEQPEALEALIRDFLQENRS